MKLITAEELIAAPNGTVFSTQHTDKLSLQDLLVKLDVESDNVIMVHDLLYGVEVDRSLRFIVKSNYNYYQYEPNDIRTMITLLQQALDS